MPDSPAPGRRFLAPAEVADMLSVEVSEVMALVSAGRLLGTRVGVPPRWRIAPDSVASYLDEQAEESRRMALWRQSNAASFPELWGNGLRRVSDEQS